MVNCATIYTVKDAVEVVRNKKISRTTIIHHTCVVLAYLYVLNVLHGDYNVEGIFKVTRLQTNVARIYQPIILSVSFTTAPSLR